MPFGYYMAEITEKPKKQPKQKPEKQPKQKPEKPPKVKPRTADLPKPPVKKDIPKPPAVQAAPPAVPEVMIDNIMNITILAAGRSAGEALDLIAGIEKNANVVTEKRGISLFSTDNKTSSDLFSRQTKLKRLASDNKLKYENMIGDGTETKTVTLMISRAGLQSFSIRVNFICTSLSQAAAGLSGCHAVWVLTNSSFYGQTPDGCGSLAASVISAAKSANIPAYIILTEFEQHGSMYLRNNMSTIDPDLYTQLKNKTDSAIGEASKDIQMIPVQVYGGQFFRDNPAAPANNHSGYEDYAPCGCHVPLLMTIQKINTGNKFVDNELIRDIKMLNLEQKSAFIQNGVKIEI